MAKQMYCYNCRKQTTYYLAKEVVSHNVILTAARCLNCNEPVNPHGLIDLNNEELNAQRDKLIDNTVDNIDGDNNINTDTDVNVDNNIDTNNN